MQSGLVTAADMDAVDGGSKPVEESPLEAFFAASNWTREDVMLAISLLQTGLLVVVMIEEIRQ